MNRRRFLHVSGTVASAAVAGCSTLPSLGEPLGPSVINRDEENSYRVEVELLRRDADELDDARVYNRTLTVSAATADQASVVRQDAVAESLPYIVRVDILELNGRVAPYHLYPDCAGERGPEERLYVDLMPDEADRIHVRFDQNGC